jgi:hypothetical protein
MERRQLKSVGRARLVKLLRKDVELPNRAVVSPE